MSRVVISLAATALLCAGCSRSGTRVIWSGARQVGQTPASVEFRLAEVTPQPGLIPTLCGSNATSTTYVHPEAILPDAAVERVDVLQWRGEGSRGSETAYIIEIAFSRDTGAKLAGITEQHNGSALALFVNGNAVVAPVIREPVTGGVFWVSGAFEKREAMALARSILGHPL